jgi:DNA-binding CsgD family transcriptional regulator
VKKSKGLEELFYKELAGIANQINQLQPDIDGLLKLFCLRKIADRKFLAAFYLQIEKDGRLYLRSYYGAVPQEVGLNSEPLSIFDSHPASEAVIRGSLTWSNGKKSDTSGRKELTPNLIAWPVMSQERILGVLLALSDTPFKGEDHELEYFEALASVIGGAIIKKLPTSNIAPSRSKQIQEQNRLTERQELILRMISEGRTNGDIADVLGYSESLIRQETIRIYAHLGCSGRSEATSIYRAMNLVSEPEKGLAKRG